MPRTFKELPVDEQIKFINKELKKNSNMSLKKVCKNFGLNKIKINDKFSKAGYEYNADHRAYTKVLLMQKHNKSISNIKNKEIEVNDPVKENFNTLDFNRLRNIENTLKEVKELIDLKDSLKEVIQYYNKSKSVIDIPIPEPVELKIDMDSFKGGLSNRVIKVYNNINQDWIKFCKKNKQFKMQDLYTQALKEFMDKYN
ncbi:hypothetical protein VT91_09650 [Clostridium sporogenes]|uniref:hypothetical protein n=1 Tax=Clostridium botulinum TaxID=1491 RepID=UPI0007176260|nr:hypothetical protein [Clostridium botulinum]KRU29351.1 hypothetical protein WG71_15940 [Clostridium sporogenes]KRU33439.1 hypothetical protein VT91_09650 [Clostridium sporogenes]KRU33929.1 hypothetical protein VT28_04850 [Clostridium sporogenes]KRU43423.1 hypothetical protein VT95_16880 [Clostridium sporogenes]MBZ1330989.1 hypothetical protein [Clostridium botulinum]